MKILSFLIATALLCSSTVEACFNDPNYTRYYAGMDRDCRNIRIDSFRREQLCIISEVKENCPQTCGVCCVSDPDYSFKLKKKKLGERNCQWLSKPERRKTYCGRWSKNRMIRDACPNECNFCQVGLLPKAPTPSPIEGTKKPTTPPTKNPTVTPTKVPTKNPTTTPTKHPTVSPTFSSESPTVDCADDLDYFIFGNPIATCSWIGKNESRRKQYCSNPDTHRACPQTCGLCCRDDPTYKITTNIKTRKGCGWLKAEKIRQRRYCSETNNGRLVKEACPQACDSCFKYLSVAPSTAPWFRFIYSTCFMQQYLCFCTAIFCRRELFHLLEYIFVAKRGEPFLFISRQYP